MRTILIPLDERPCNVFFPQMIADTQESITLITPPAEMLGNKKEPADTVLLCEFLEELAKTCDNMIVSIDMLLYGGLIPSRLHHLKEEEVISRLDILQRIKRTYPHIKIYAFHCIMRSPSYDSAEEEPEYYEDYGHALFTRKYLLDYQQRHGLSQAEETQLQSIHIPDDILADYEGRRDFNTKMNLEVIQYVADGCIDFLVIPQDDSSPYGYTAIAQKIVVDKVKRLHLDHNIMIYPGADEVAMSLLARSYHEFMGIEPKVYPFYASVLGPTLVPNYEDRPMLESLKSHIRVCKAKLVEHYEQADLLLAINAPGKIMQEAFVKENELDISYTSYRNLLDFAYKIKDFIDDGYRVALCDSAFSNGGDRQLISYLDDLDVLDKLCSYAGWNTNCNSLGTTLAQAFLGQAKIYENLCYRIIEDVFYQTIVRSDVVDHCLPVMGLSYYDFKDKQAEVEHLIKEKLQELYNQLNMSKKLPVQIIDISMPWRRMFEIGMRIKVDTKTLY